MSLAAWAVIGFGSGLSDLPDDGTYARWSAGAGALGALGLMGVWLFRRTRRWMIAALLYALYTVTVVIKFVLEG